MQLDSVEHRYLSAMLEPPGIVYDFLFPFGRVDPAPIRSQFSAEHELAHLAMETAVRDYTRPHKHSRWIGGAIGFMAARGRASVKRDEILYKAAARQRHRKYWSDLVGILKNLSISCLHRLESNSREPSMAVGAFYAK